MLGKRKRIIGSSAELNDPSTVEVQLLGFARIPRRYESDAESETENVYEMAEHISDFVKSILTRIVRSYRVLGFRRRRLR